MSEPFVGQTVFVTWVVTPRQRDRARLLVDSIRAFGGTLSRCPIWLFEANPDKALCQDLAGKGIEVLPLSVPGSVRHYPFASKVAACARAEELAGPEVETLIWLSPPTLIVQPPVLFELGRSFDAAVRPVHIQNVGLLATEAVDEFWRGIYRGVGVDAVEATVESFVDAQHIRAYFNSAAYSVKPAAGLFRRWLACFEALVGDEAYQSRACQDERHQIFLHQAILSTLIASDLDPDRLRILPPDYGYPYNLHRDVRPERRAATLNELTCVIYEERSVDPRVVEDIGIEEPLRSWLSARFEQRE
jgi:hypothetical protein